MNIKQLNNLRKFVSAGPSKGKNGILRWLVAFIILIVGGGITGVINQDNSPTPSTVIHNHSDIEEALKAFDGKDLVSLPQMVKLPVTYDRVVDGDTQIVKMNGYSLRVRHLMIDTPESVKEGTSIQPFGKEASHRNHELLSQAETLYLMLDVGPATDQYNRVLAYLYADEVLIAEQLLAEGFASVRYINPPNNSFDDEFLAAQKKAKDAKLNIWSIDGYVESNGYFNQVD